MIAVLLIEDSILGTFEIDMNNLEEIVYFLPNFIIDDAFFQSDWAGACLGRWVVSGLMLGWSAGSGCGSSLQKEQERRRAGRGFVRSRSDA